MRRASRRRASRRSRAADRRPRVPRPSPHYRNPAPARGAGLPPASCDRAAAPAAASAPPASPWPARRGAARTSGPAASVPSPAAAARPPGAAPAREAPPEPRAAWASPGTRAASLSGRPARAIRSPRRAAARAPPPPPPRWPRRSPSARAPPSARRHRRSHPPATRGRRPGPPAHRRIPRSSSRNPPAYRTARSARAPPPDWWIRCRGTHPARAQPARSTPRPAPARARVRAPAPARAEVWGRRRPRRVPAPGRRRLVDVEEHQARRLLLPRLRGLDPGLGLGRGRGRGATERPPLRIPIHPQMLFQQLPQMSALRRDVGELLQRREGLLDLSRLLHPLGVLEEVLFGLGHEPLGRIQLGELEIGRLPCGRVAQHLVAHRDGVVVEAELGVLVHRPVVVIGRLGGVLDLEIQVADAIKDGEVRVRLPICLLCFQRFQPRLDGPPGVLGLEASGPFLLLLKLGHGALKIPALGRADKRNLLSRRRLRDFRPTSTPLPASPTRHRRPSPRENPARSGPGLGRAPGPRRRSRSRP